eukprot:IDg9356t1
MLKDRRCVAGASELLYLCRSATVHASSAYSFQQNVNYKGSSK